MSLPPRPSPTKWPHEPGGGCWPPWMTASTSCSASGTRTSLSGRPGSPRPSDNRIPRSRPHDAARPLLLCRPGRCRGQRMLGGLRGGRVRAGSKPQDRRAPRAPHPGPAGPSVEQPAPAMARPLGGPPLSPVLPGVALAAAGSASRAVPCAVG